MKNILLLFISMSVFNTHNVIAQISTHVYVNVPAENSAEFERLEIDYWSKIAKKGIDEGKMTAWGLLKTVGIDNVTHVIVNVFESIEQATNSGSVWDPSAIGMDAREISTVDLRKTIAVVNYQTEVQEDYGEEPTNFTIFNYANPNNVAAFINENKTLWKEVHKKSLGISKRTSWGVHTRIHPQGNETYSSIWTRDGFKTLADAMNYLIYKENNPMHAMTKASKMSKILPQGFKKSVIRETLHWEK